MRRLWVPFAVAVLASVSFALPAGAHAAYRDSSPRDEATVTSPPSSVWAEYTEPLQDGSNMEIYDPCGQRVDHDDTQITGYRMTVSMTGERSGTYSVNWVAASAIDPHVTRGTFTFTVTEGPACEAAADETDETTEKDQDDPDRSEESSTRSDDESTSTQRTSDGTDARDTTRSRQDTRVRGTRVTTNRRAGKNRVDLAQERSPQPTSSETSAWDGMQWDWFAIALALSALIGAAGGRIYAGIMGPRR